MTVKNAEAQKNIGPGRVPIEDPSLATPPLRVYDLPSTSFNLFL